MEFIINNNVIIFLSGLFTSIIGFLAFIFRIKKVTIDQIEKNKEKISIIESTIENLEINIDRQNKMVIKLLRFILRNMDNKENLEGLEEEIDSYLFSLNKAKEGNT